MSTNASCDDVLSITQAFLNKKLDLDFFQLEALHHLIEVKVSESKYVSDSVKNLKFSRLALKREILSLKNKSEHASIYGKKRKRFRNLDTDALLKKVNS